MRTIKFRAWNKKEKYMSEEISLEFLWKGGVKGVNMFLWSKDLIVMQFTGLFDRNKKEIYEGDILGREYRPWFEKPNGKMETATVVYEKDQFVGDNSTGIQYFISNPHPYYVIGNIWENPNLLKIQDSK